MNESNRKEDPRVLKSAVILTLIISIIGLCISLYFLQIIDNNNLIKKREEENYLRTRNEAIEELFVLKGRVEEVGILIEKCSNKEDVFLEELEKLKKYNFNSMYLNESNFVILIPNTDDVKNLSDEILKQIDQEIYRIKDEIEGVKSPSIFYVNNLPAMPVVTKALAL